MDEELIEKVSNKIYRRFPAVQGARPRVQVRQDGREKSSRVKPTYILAYHSKVEITAYKSLPYWVRVVVDENGKILKITTSR